MKEKKKISKYFVIIGNISSQSSSLSRVWKTYKKRDEKKKIGKKCNVSKDKQKGRGGGEDRIGKSGKAKRSDSRKGRRRWNERNLAEEKIFQERPEIFKNNGRTDDDKRLVTRYSTICRRKTTPSDH